MLAFLGVKNYNGIKIKSTIRGGIVLHYALCDIENIGEFHMSSHQKHCDYTFALSDISQCERLISEIDDFPTWAYIKHSPDDENGSVHYHFYIHLSQPLSISNLSNKLDISPNMIEWVRVKTKLIQYLIHKNNPEKNQYNPDDIITNDREYINNFLFPENNKVDIYREFKDLNSVANGFITPYEYLSNNNYSISSLPFYSRQLFLARLINLAEKGEVSKNNRF